MQPMHPKPLLQFPHDPLPGLVSGGGKTNALEVRNRVCKSCCFRVQNRFGFGWSFYCFFGRQRSQTSTSQPTPWRSSHPW
jgi:hypothetical protein